jgi:hypothetical protein
MTHVQTHAQAIITYDEHAKTQREVETLRIDLARLRADLKQLRVDVDQFTVAKGET